jgi:hypothetical protein
MFVDTRSKLMNTLYCIVLLGAVTFGSYEMFSARTGAQGARSIHRIEIEPETLAPGQKFHITAYETLYKNCPFEVRWSLIRTRDHIEALRVVENVRPARSEIGDVVVEHNHYIPPEVEPGPYDYSVQIVDQCPEHTYLSSFTTPIIVIKGAARE